jgi:hypothetical protein
MSPVSLAPLVLFIRGEKQKHAPDEWQPENQLSALVFADDTRHSRQTQEDI